MSNTVNLSGGLIFRWHFTSERLSSGRFVYRDWSRLFDVHGVHFLWLGLLNMCLVGHDATGAAASVALAVVWAAVRSTSKAARSLPWALSFVPRLRRPQNVIVSSVDLLHRLKSVLVAVLPLHFLGRATTRLLRLWLNLPLRHGHQRWWLICSRCVGLGSVGLVTAGW